MDFQSLKKNRQSVFANLSTEFSKLNTTTTQQEDNRFWKPDVDKAGNGYAIIRFLPAPQNEDVPFVRVWDHGFQGPGGWYIEKSLTTLGQKDPVSEHNTLLWNSGIESNKELVRKQKRRLSYYSNIYVVKDPSNPDNEGKVFLFKYGKKIFEKLKEAMEPKFEDESPINPFDLWGGANFKLKIRNVEGYRNYDKSEFDAPAPLLDNDEKLEKIWKTEYELSEFVDPKNFKSYDELKNKLDRVLGLTNASPRPQTSVNDLPWDSDEQESHEAPKAMKTKSPPAISSLDEDDEDIDFFKKLASD
jgi:hypothetical protein